jgi:hypothetical protein
MAGPVSTPITDTNVARWLTNGQKTDEWGDSASDLIEQATAVSASSPQAVLRQQLTIK